MEKTIRFGDLVRSSGRPQTHTLWTDAKQDKALQKAIKNNQVLTIIQEPTSKHKDYGRIGFHQQPGASYLIFPRSLSANDNEARVIGINYQLIEEPAVTNPVKAEDLQPKQIKKKPLREEPKSKKIHPAVEIPKPSPAKKKFSITVKRTAILKTKMEVEAQNRAEAEREAMKLVKEQPFSAEQGKIEDQIVKT